MHNDGEACNGRRCSQHVSSSEAKAGAAGLSHCPGRDVVAAFGPMAPPCSVCIVIITAVVVQGSQRVMAKRHAPFHGFQGLPDAT